MSLLRVTVIYPRWWDGGEDDGEGEAWWVKREGGLWMGGWEFKEVRVDEGAEEWGEVKREIRWEGRGGG